MDEKSDKHFTFSEKDKHKALKAAVVTEGVSSVTIEGHDMVVVGNFDPVDVLVSVRKVLSNAKIVSVGPANLLGPEKTLAGEERLVHGGYPAYPYCSNLLPLENTEEDPYSCAIM